MKDLTDFQRFQIQSLQARICELENINNQLAEYCFEALDKDCPKEYKLIIKKEFKSFINNNDSSIKIKKRTPQYIYINFND